MLDDGRGRADVHFSWTQTLRPLRRKVAPFARLFATVPANHPHFPLAGDSRRINTFQTSCSFRPTPSSHRTLCTTKARSSSRTRPHVFLPTFWPHPQTTVLWSLMRRRLLGIRRPTSSLSFAGPFRCKRKGRLDGSVEGKDKALKSYTFNSTSSSTLEIIWDWPSHQLLAKIQRKISARV